MKPFIVIQSNSKEGFEDACKKASEDDYIFCGQMVITGLGQGKFMYSQQWGKGIAEPINEEDELSGDNPQG